MTTMAPPSFFLLCCLLRSASSAFPEEPGPLNFIPTEGTDLLTFLASETPTPLACLSPKSSRVRCEGWIVVGRGVKVCPVAVRHVGCWVLSRSGGVRSQSEGRGLSDSWLSHTHTHTHFDPQQRQLLTHSDFETPYQPDSLQLRPDLDWLQFNNIDRWFPSWVQTLLSLSIPKQRSIELVRMLRATPVAAASDGAAEVYNR